VKNNGRWGEIPQVDKSLASCSFGVARKFLFREEINYSMQTKYLSK
jgi:hypothetical protein